MNNQLTPFTHLMITPRGGYSRSKIAAEVVSLYYQWNETFTILKSTPSIGGMEIYAHDSEDLIRVVVKWEEGFSGESIRGLGIHSWSRFNCIEDMSEELEEYLDSRVKVYNQPYL